jgi:hypothetical protein
VPTSWRPPRGLRLACLVIGGFFICGAVAFFRHVLLHRGTNADFFPGRPANIVAGVVFVGGACFAILWALRASLTVDADEVVVQGPFRATRVPRSAIERVWAYNGGWLRIRYAVGGHTRSLTTGVTQGYLGVRLFGHETRSALAVRSINELLGLGLPD